jgi:DNA polymerase IV (archaeal DinB-like DNA polymerase)
VPKPETKDFEEATIIAMRIQDEIKSRERITCSVGVAPNKIIAKIASKVKKPDGLTVVSYIEVRDFLFSLVCRLGYISIGSEVFQKGK